MVLTHFHAGEWQWVGSEISNYEIDFLTTDNQLLRLAARWSGQIRLRVANPLTWLEEVTEK